jgi:hypothetical protein
LSWDWQAWWHSLCHPPVTAVLALLAGVLILIGR